MSEIKNQGEEAVRYLIKKAGGMKAVECCFFRAVQGPEKMLKMIHML